MYTKGRDESKKRRALAVVASPGPLPARRCLGPARPPRRRSAARRQVRGPESTGTRHSPPRRGRRPPIAHAGLGGHLSRSGRLRCSARGECESPRPARGSAQRPRQALRWEPLPGSPGQCLLSAGRRGLWGWSLSSFPHFGANEPCWNSKIALPHSVRNLCSPGAKLRGAGVVLSGAGGPAAREGGAGRGSRVRGGGQSP